MVCVCVTMYAGETAVVNTILMSDCVFDKAASRYFNEITQV